ncbi:MAG TPA: ribose 5-phosphate isomerase A [Candidatus Dormibacteraeota bacterium]|nr:ribose 5-phosphate isomerase A [Candidatus Dormibacteraeota bacterium]
MNHEKRVVGEKAADLIQDKMIVGLGTGSTVHYTIKKIGEKVQRNELDINCVPTSNASAEFARSLGIKLSSLNDVPQVDITIDGADEIDDHFRAIKGGGGALLFEKIVASNSEKVVIIIDSTKYVDKIGKFSLPIEVIPFGYQYVFETLKREGFQPKLRKIDHVPFTTDSGNYIFDMNISHMIDKMDTEHLEQFINNIPGVVENGLFLNLIDVIYIGKNGGIEMKTKNVDR